MTSKIGLVVPVRNACCIFDNFITGLRQQTVTPHRLLAIDSSSDDGSDRLFRDAGFEIHVIPPSEFDHGGTRQIGVEMMAEVDIVIFLTQDAILEHPKALENLLACFSDEQVGAAFGRQLPRPEADPIEAHARLFNYPDTSQIRTLKDIEKMGIKAAFFSDVFSAYRRQVLLEVGGFPENIIFGEDTYVAAKLLLKGWKLAYCAEARVFHSHDYSFAQDFRRYFDIGVFHHREPWLLKTLGKPEGEGRRYVMADLNYLFKHNPKLIPAAMLRYGLKLLAYRLGLLEEKIPRWIKIRLSFHKLYWRKVHN